MRRMLPPTLVVIALFSIGCEDGRASKLETENQELTARVEELEGKLAEVEAKAEDVRSACDAVNGAVDDVQSSIKKFDFEDWKNVVPAVRNAASDAESEGSSLDSAVTDLQLACDAS